MDGIKSKERVQEFGEVFTPDNIVNDMLNLLPEEELLRTYLEPACGNGNFLIRILDRKLGIVAGMPKDKQELALVKAVSSIYGVDIQADNVEHSKQRMWEVIRNGATDVLELEGAEKQVFTTKGFEISPELEKVIDFILDTNIQCGDALSGKVFKMGKAMEIKSENFPDESILTLTEYMFNGNNVMMTEYRLAESEGGNCTPLTIKRREFESIEYVNMFNRVEIVREEF